MYNILYNELDLDNPEGYKEVGVDLHPDGKVWIMYETPEGARFERPLSGADYVRDTSDWKKSSDVEEVKIDPEIYKQTHHRLFVAYVGVLDPDMATSYQTAIDNLGKSVTQDD